MALIAFLLLCPPTGRCTCTDLPLLKSTRMLQDNKHVTPVQVSSLHCPALCWHWACVQERIGAPHLLSDLMFVAKDSFGLFVGMVYLVYGQYGLIFFFISILINKLIPKSYLLVRRLCVCIRNVINNLHLSISVPKQVKMGWLSTQHSAAWEDRKHEQCSCDVGPQPPVWDGHLAWSGMEMQQLQCCFSAMGRTSAAVFLAGGVQQTLWCGLIWQSSNAPSGHPRKLG